VAPSRLSNFQAIGLCIEAFGHLDQANILVAQAQTRGDITTFPRFFPKPGNLDGMTSVEGFHTHVHIGTYVTIWEFHEAIPIRNRGVGSVKPH
jgi:hypothetical protein